MYDGTPTDMSEAPFLTDVSPGPSDGTAYWVDAPDGVRLRVAAWGTDAPKGTVLLFPGRTEYVEKYGQSAQELADRGYATLCIDWRGQGLAERFLPDRRIGQVEKFTDYQKDVAAMLRAAQNLDLPKPYVLLGHSMGGCIGLRSMMEGLDVKAAAFTGPMWGIKIAPHLVVPAWVLAHAMPALGLHSAIPPGRNITPYVLIEPFENNMLTTDRPMWDMMVEQLKAMPDLGLGAPSYQWLREGLYDTLALARLTSPSQPAVTYLGTNERIVHIGRIEERMAQWPNGRLEIVDKGEHEVQMEGPEMRTWLFDDMVALFDAA